MATRTATAVLYNIYTAAQCTDANDARIALEAIYARATEAEQMLPAVLRRIIALRKQLAKFEPEAFEAPVADSTEEIEEVPAYTTEEIAEHNATRAYGEANRPQCLATTPTDFKHLATAAPLVRGQHIGSEQARENEAKFLASLYAPEIVASEPATAKYAHLYGEVMAQFEKRGVEELLRERLGPEMGMAACEMAVAGILVAKRFRGKVALAFAKPGTATAAVWATEGEADYTTYSGYQCHAGDVVVCDAAAQQLDATVGKYAIMCEAHSVCGYAATIHSARIQMNTPALFCEGCKNDLLNPKQ